MKLPEFSTTKLVFIIIACSLVVFTYKGLIDPKDFFGLAMVVFYHYYNKPKETPGTDLPVKEEEQLG
jgi:hypothetical protein